MKETTKQSTKSDEKGRSTERTRVIFRRVPLQHETSVGNRLADARSAAGRTLSECARRVGVPERYLNALEREDVDALPGLVYEKHFLTRYAELLNLQPAPLVTAWADLRSETATADPVVRHLPWRDLTSGPVLWRRLLVAAATLSFIGYLGTELVVMASPPVIQLSEPGAGAVVTNATLMITGSVQPRATVSVNGQAVPARTDGSFAVPVTLAPGPNSIRVVAEKRYGRAAVVERQVFFAAPHQDAAVPSFAPTL